MTLLDARDGMAEIFAILAVESGVPLDGQAFASRLGPPLESEFARYGLPHDQICDLVHRFRELYPEVVIPRSRAMPGAVAAVDAVRAAGGRAVVVTGKHRKGAQASVELIGVTVDAVIADSWGPDKGRALVSLGAEAYVGDHLADIAGARAAEALAIGVATGPISAADLQAAGADVVLPDLFAFPAWLDSYLLATVH